MTRLTEDQRTARAIRDLYSTRHAMSTSGLVLRIVLVVIWLSSVLFRISDGTQPSWFTVLFAMVFTVVAREVWDGFRRRRYERWRTEQIIKEQRENDSRGTTGTT